MKLPSSLLATFLSINFMSSSVNASVLTNAADNITDREKIASLAMEHRSILKNLFNNYKSNASSSYSPFISGGQRRGLQDSRVAQCLYEVQHIHDPFLGIQEFFDDDLCTVEGENSHTCNLSEVTEYEGECAGIGDNLSFYRVDMEMACDDGFSARYIGAPLCIGESCPLSYMPSLYSEFQAGGECTVDITTTTEDDFEDYNILQCLEDNDQLLEDFGRNPFMDYLPFPPYEESPGCTTEEDSDAIVCDLISFAEEAKGRCDELGGVSDLINFSVYGCREDVLDRTGLNFPLCIAPSCNIEALLSFYRTNASNSGECEDTIFELMPSAKSAKKAKGAKSGKKVKKTKGPKVRKSKAPKV